MKSQTQCNAHLRGYKICILPIYIARLTITLKMADQGRSDFYVVFSHDSLRTWIKTIVNKFAISNYTPLILGVHALRSYLKLICEYELHSLPNKKVSRAKVHDKNYIKIKPPLVHYLLRNCVVAIEEIIA